MQDNIPFMDSIVYHLVMLALFQMPGIIPIDDFDSNDRACIHDQQEHRIYTFHAHIRDDFPVPVTQFCALLAAYSRHTPVKPQLYNIEQYSLPNNYHSTYWSVCI